MALRRNSKATVFAVTALVLICQGKGEGAEWSAVPSVTLREDYDDNIFLLTQSHSTVTSTTVTPRLGAAVSSDNWQVTGGLELSRRRFPGEAGLDSDAQNINFGSAYQTERSVWQLNATSSKTSFLASEAISPEIGLFVQNTDSDMKTISPSWTWSMTELTQLQLAYSQSDVSYVNGQSLGIFDYRSSSVSATLTNQIDDHTQIFLTPSYSVFRVPATTSETKATLYQVGATRNFSETLRGTLSLGGRRSSNQQEGVVCTLSFGPFCLQTKQETFSSRSSNSLYNGNLEKRFETVTFTAAVSRSFDPTAFGEQARTDSILLALSRPLTPTLNGNLAVSRYSVRSGTGIVTNIDHTVYQVEPSFSWTWAPEWNLSMDYRYRHLHRVGEATAATGNAAYLTLSYQWPKLSISR